MMHRVGVGRRPSRAALRIVAVVAALRGSCSRPRWAGCPPAAWGPSSRATQSSPQMIVASSPYPLALEHAHRPEPGARGDADRADAVVARGRGACDMRPVARSIEVGPFVRAEAVIRAVDAALDVQLVAADRPDARVEDGDVGVDRRPAARGGPRRAGCRRGLSGWRAGSGEQAGPTRPRRRDRAGRPGRVSGARRSPDTAYAKRWLVRKS